MSYHEYRMSLEIELEQYPFYALIMAVMRQADTENVGKLQGMWPEVWDELTARYNAPGGLLPGEEQPKATCASLMPERDREDYGITNWNPRCCLEPGHDEDHAISQEGLAWINHGD